MRSLLAITALVEPVAGLGLLCCPSVVVVLLIGEPIDGPASVTLARIGGAGLTALGVACWFARSDSRSRSAGGLVVAMLLYNIATVCILGFAGVGLGMHGALLWPGVVLHAILAVWCVACLARSAQRMSGPARETGI